MSTLPKRLRLIRERAGLTQQSVSEKTGINRNTLANWELGRTTPKWDDVKILADFYGVSVDWLIGRTDIRETPEKKEALPDPDEQFFLRASKLSEEGKKKLWEFLEYVEHWEAEHRKKKQQDKKDD